MGRSGLSVEKAIERFKLSRLSERRVSGPKSYQQKRPSFQSILKSVLFHESLKFDLENINWEKMPLPETRWQKHAVSSSIQKKVISKKIATQLRGFQGKVLEMFDKVC